MFGNNGSRIASWLIKFMPTSRWHGLKRFLLRKLGGMEIGSGTRIWSGARFTGRYIKIGRNCHIGRGCDFCACSSEGILTIGDEVSFGPEVFITTGTHDVGDFHRRSGRGKSAPIVINSGTAVSVRSIIMAGVTIGKGAFVGPGVTLTMNLADNTMISQSGTKKYPLPDEGIKW